MSDKSKIIEYYLDKPYWVIDILPKQVPADGCEQYFEIERYVLKHDYDKLLKRFANVVLKLNCYYDLEVCRSSIDEWTINPTPENLVAWVLDSESLCLLLKDADAMIALNRDDTYMTLYNPSEELVKLTSIIAFSEGFFIWKPS
jgi:hypothetical protein